LHYHQAPAAEARSVIIIKHGGTSKHPTGYNNQIASEFGYDLSSTDYSRKALFGNYTWRPA
jgi:hypothetical protein